MSYPPGVFSVYLLSYCSHGSRKSSGLYIVTFPNRTRSDEWWRAAQFVNAAQFASYNQPRGDGSAPMRYGVLERLSPQVYRYAWGSPLQTFDTSNFLRGFWAKEFQSQIIVQEIQSHSMIASDSPGARGLNNLIEISVPSKQGSKAGTGVHVEIPQILGGVEPISGKWYYIRSVASPYEYWHIPHGHGAVGVSRQNRTRFRIDILISVGGGVMSYGPGTIIVPRDPISLTASTRHSGNLEIVTRGDGDDTTLYHGENSLEELEEAAENGEEPPAKEIGRTSWEFRDFIDGFLVDREDGEDEGHHVAMANKGEGELWELVL